MVRSHAGGTRGGVLSPIIPATGLVLVMYGTRPDSSLVLVQ
jgi:hypothetical protein